MDTTLVAMRASYGRFVDRRMTLQLDSSNVPPELVKYIPYAALWGVADDLERENLIAEAPPEARSDLKRIVNLIDDLLDMWLAGEEAQSLTPSKEYIAFSAMRMAADFI